MLFFSIYKFLGVPLAVGGSAFVNRSKKTSVNKNEAVLTWLDFVNDEMKILKGGYSNDPRSGELHGITPKAAFATASIWICIVRFN